MKKGQASYKDRYLMLKKQYDELNICHDATCSELVDTREHYIRSREEYVELEQKYNALLSTTESNE